LGLFEQYGKNTSEGSQFLRKIFGLSLLPPSETSDCLAIDFFYPVVRTTDEWKSFATIFQQVMLMQTPLILRLFGLNVLHRHLGPQTGVNHYMSIAMHNFTLRILIFLFLYLHKKYRLRLTSKGEALLHEDLKNQQQSK
jgi:hypothetical protein